MQMNLLSGEVQLGITYTLTPSVYLTGAPMVYPSHFPAQNYPSEREINLETSLIELQQKCLLLMRENQDLRERMEEMRLREGAVHSVAETASTRRKFIRRKEDELDKKYKCCFDGCKKEYASTLALNLHIKNKHHGGTQKQMEELAKRIVEAEIKGEEAPNEDIRLPQGFVDHYRRQMMAGQSSTSQPCSHSQ